MMKVITAKLRRRAGKKVKPNCYHCLNSSRRSPTLGILPDGMLYCSVWQCVVSCTQAKICSEFIPDSPPRRDRRRGEVA